MTLHLISQMATTERSGDRCSEFGCWIIEPAMQVRGDGARDTVRTDWCEYGLQQMSTTSQRRRCGRWECHCHRHNWASRTLVAQTGCWADPWRKPLRIAIRTTGMLILRCEPSGLRRCSERVGGMEVLYAIQSALIGQEIVERILPRIDGNCSASGLQKCLEKAMAAAQKMLRALPTSCQIRI